MWSGGGEKYGFRQQHIAGERNFFSLATALAPLLNAAGQAEVREVLIPGHLFAAEKAIQDVYREKLGLLEWDAGAAALFKDMDIFMEETEADYTIFWRQLSLLPGMFLPAVEASAPEEGATTVTFTSMYSDETLMQPLSDVFYRSLQPREVSKWASLLRTWLELLHSQLHVQSQVAGEHNLSGATVSAQMLRVNPKYVPREWMLVEAYVAAAEGNFAHLEKLQSLFASPYDEHSAEDERLFFRKMPVEMLDTGGVTTMT